MVELLIELCIVLLVSQSDGIGLDQTARGQGRWRQKVEESKRSPEVRLACAFLKIFFVLTSALASLDLVFTSSTGVLVHIIGIVSL